MIEILLSICFIHLNWWSNDTDGYFAGFAVFLEHRRVLQKCYRALCMYQNCFSNCLHGYLFWSFFFRLSPMQGLIWKQRKSEQSAISVWWYIKSAGKITRGVRATMLRQMKIFNARKNVAVNINMWQITIEENDSLDQYSHKKKIT